MARPKSAYPTDLELEILKVIWRDGGSTARHVTDALAPTRHLAFTSVVTIMNIMVRKKYLVLERRTRGEGGNLYAAKVAETSTASKMLHSLSRRLFGGSIAHAMATLVRAGEIDREELKELRSLVSKKSKGRGP